jgi:para-nitrobenzyl esterase
MSTHRSLLAFAAALLFSLACGRPDAAPEADPGSARTLSLGRVIGAAGTHGGHVWRGIPFAKPPADELRWRAPRPPEPWQGTFEALEDPRSCAQFATMAGGRDGAEPDTPTGSENCLQLNVFAPAFAPDAVPQGDARLPVMFWIHGGGNTIGEAATYDASVLASRHDVIVVAVQYRLGPFGWFRHASLREGASAEDASGNYGTLDLVAGLRFVRDHIAAFGGDPDNVTIFGESAGGRNVFTLLLAPEAGGLFHRAIVQSGSVRYVPPEMAEDEAAGREAGVSNTSDVVVRRLLGDAADGPPAEVAAALRETEVADVLGAYRGPRTMGMIRMPQIFAEGSVLPAEDPLEALAAGRYHQVPVMLGTNRDEMKLFLLGDRELVNWTFGLPLGLRDPERYERDASTFTRWWKLQGVDAPARGMRAAQGPSVFAYRFDWDEEPTILWVDFAELVGAAHAVELPFVFGIFDLGPLGRVLFDEDNAEARDRLSEAMRSYWVEFARNGAPGRGVDGSLPEWTPWDDTTPESPRLLVLDTEADGGVRMSADQVTQAGLLAELAADPRFASEEERCAMLTALSQRRGVPAPEDFPAGGCASAGGGL